MIEDIRYLAITFFQKVKPNIDSFVECAYNQTQDHSVVSANKGWNP